MIFVENTHIVFGKNTTSPCNQLGCRDLLYVAEGIER